MQYWLRRNNIENGPYTREALISQGLQTTDLVRVDGYPDWKPVTAFQELQSALQSPAKPKYKFTADKQLIEIKDTDKDKAQSKNTENPEAPTSTKSHQPPGSVPGSGTDGAKSGAAGSSHSPFKRMPSALPKKRPSAPPPSDHTSLDATEKAKERARINAAGKGTGAEYTATGADSGQTAAGSGHLAAGAASHAKMHNRVQSLDDAPLREVRHHPTPKPVRTQAKPQNSHFFKEFFLPIIIIGALGLLAWWAYQQFTAPSMPATSAVGADSSRPAELATSQRPGEQQSSHSNTPSDGPAAIPVTRTPKNSTAKQTNKQPSSQQSAAAAATAPGTKDSTPAKKPAARQPAATTAAAPANTAKTSQDSKEQQQKPPAEKKTTAQSTTTPATATAQKEQDKADTPAVATAKKTSTKKDEPKAPAKKAPVKKAASISDFVRLSLNKTPQPGIKNIKIKVHNSSKEDLNIAVVEVKYFDKDGKFIQGETLQTGKINAGKSTTLKIPSSKNAEKITYKVSLISGDNVYLMGH